jgi:hypothetical protein
LLPIIVISEQNNTQSYCQGKILTIFLRGQLGEQDPSHLPFYTYFLEKGILTNNTDYLLENAINLQTFVRERFRDNN